MSVISLMAKKNWDICKIIEIISKYIVDKFISTPIPISDI